MAVEPTLASTIYANLQSKQTDSRPRKRVKTGCSPVDDALCGGLDFGSISCISGDADGARSVITLHVIASHLLASPTAHVAVIDPAGNFDVLRLHEVLSDHVKHGRTSVATTMEPPNLDNLLERVKLMRVFDFVGLNEAINEFKTDLEQPTRTDRPPSQLQRERTVVPDSEDEEDDMLFEVSSPLVQQARDQKGEEMPAPGAVEEHIWLLLIDNFAQTINPILKANYVQAQALMITFFRSLMYLTRNYDICTLIMNDVVAPKATNMHRSVAEDVEKNTAGGVSEQNDFLRVEQPSIFASNTMRPALGKTFAGCLDVHIMLSMLPLKKRDAQLLYGTYPEHRQQKAEKAHVLEVLSDRWHGRVGRWAAFRVVDGSTLKGIP